ncbi:hypothetical protein [Mucilaginibacter polytrichastri]|nr:hypothetical protein [Mucilaginibacter polytrichastri]
MEAQNYRWNAAKRSKVRGRLLMREMIKQIRLGNFRDRQELEANHVFLSRLKLAALNIFHQLLQVINIIYN